MYLVNHIPAGAPCKLYEKNGIDYYQSDVGEVKTLSFNSAHTYRKCNWYECFLEAHSLYDTLELVHNFGTYNWFMSRLWNNKADYNEVAVWADNYFKELTADPTVGFSLSEKSMIYFTDRGKNHIEQYHKLD